MVNIFRRSPLHDSWRWLLVLGLVALAGGVLAFVHPFAASLTVVACAGLAFIVMGVLKFLYAARIRSDSAYIVSLVIAALFILLGAWLWINPLAGLVSLTAMAGGLFLGLGVFKTIFAFRLRPGDGWGFVLLSGLVSILLGVAIFAAFPAAATKLLGILLGIELISTGIAFIMAGLFLSRY